MKSISTLLYLLLYTTFLFGQEIMVKTEDQEVRNDFIKRFEHSQEIIKNFFKTDKLDTIARYRQDLSTFKSSFVRYKTHSDSIKSIPEEYNFSFDFLKKEKFVDNLNLRVSIDNKIQKKINEWSIKGLTGIRIILKGKSLISRDSIERISQHYYPSKETLIQLDSNYDPFNNNKTVSYYWTIRKSEDLNKNEYQFIQVDLTTGKIETMIQKIR